KMQQRYLLRNSSRSSNRVINSRVSKPFLTEKKPQKRQQTRTRRTNNKVHHTNVGANTLAAPVHELISHVKLPEKLAIAATEHKKRQRHSLRLTEKQQNHPTVGISPFRKVQTSLPSSRETIKSISIIEVPRWRLLSPHDAESQQGSESDVEEEDNIIERHHKNMLEEQKDRKLYERWVRNQRALRKIQCRRTHTQSLAEQTRQKLIRQLEKEEKIFVNDKICSKLAKYTLVFEHNVENILSPNYHLIDWKRFQSILTPDDLNTELDVMIRNLKAVRLTTRLPKSTPPIGNKRRPPIRERLNEKAKEQQSLTPKKTRNERRTTITRTRSISPRSSENITSIITVQNPQLISSSQKFDRSNVLNCPSYTNRSNISTATTNENDRPSSTKKFHFQRSKSISTGFDMSLKKRTRSNEKENCNSSAGSHSYRTRQTL
ncbi:unnamed protein product, partial [Didymodactylos carnosus]